MSKLIVAIVTGALLLGSASDIFAQKKKDGSEKKTKETVAMSQAVYEKLTEIQEMIESKDYASAQRLIDDLKTKKGLSEYELAQVYNISGYSYYLQERYDDAIRAYDQMLAQAELPEALTLSTLKTKAQLQFTQADYEGALVTVRELLKAVTEPSADVLMLEGQALFHRPLSQPGPDPQGKLVTAVARDLFRAKRLRKHDRCRERTYCLLPERYLYPDAGRYLQ